MISGFIRQRGHAVLLFALLLPIMWGLFTLAIDGARALQNKARLGDAVEVSTLALASHNSEDVKANRELVTRYIDTYVVDKDSIERIDIERTECKASDQHECDGSTRYNEYAVDVVTKHSPWLPVADGMVGFSESYEVGHGSVARKYQGDSIDISFVVDYSGSMDDYWKGQRKYIALRKIVDNVLDELETHQATVITPIRVSVIPYSEYTRKPLVGEELSGLASCKEEEVPEPEQCREQCKIAYQQCRADCRSPGKKECREDCKDDRKDCRKECPKSWDYNPGKLKVLNFVDELLYINNGRSVDINTTITKLWQNNAENEQMICNHNKYDDRTYPFHNIAFTENFEQIKSGMRSFRPDGWTGSYQGIIKSAQYFERLPSPNPRQLMVILSDGLDKVGSGTFSDGIPSGDLVDAGLCREIKRKLDGRTTDNNRPVNFQMAFVGFDYKVSDNRALAECVGIENVYDAADPDELLDIILNLISEEIGHFK
ncbi:MAG: hypothetical protein LPH19_10750 [Shewanella sp.]|nr:hypothetical protein [Shewanella sp.]